MIELVKIVKENVWKQSIGIKGYHETQDGNSEATREKVCSLKNKNKLLQKADNELMRSIAK